MFRRICVCEWSTAAPFGSVSSRWDTVAVLIPPPRLSILCRLCQTMCQICHSSTLDLYHAVMATSLPRVLYCEPKSASYVLGDAG